METTIQIKPSTIKAIMPKGSRWNLIHNKTGNLLGLRTVTKVQSLGRGLVEVQFDYNGTFTGLILNENQSNTVAIQTKDTGLIHRVTIRDYVGNIIAMYERD